MCDYSLAAFRNRLAVEGEELIVYRFPTGCLGLISPAAPEAVQRAFGVWQPRFNAHEFPCAVCIPHGASLLLRDIPKHLQQRVGVGAEEHVTFIQMSASGRYRDGVRFRKGQELLLQQLLQGQRADVLSLSSPTLPEEETDAMLETVSA